MITFQDKLIDFPSFHKLWFSKKKKGPKLSLISNIFLGCIHRNINS